MAQCTGLLLSEQVMRFVNRKHKTPKYHMGITSGNTRNLWCSASTACTDQ